MNVSDVLIIGGGVVGMSAALELARRGMRVTVLERGTAGCESSWAGGGILSPLCPWDYPDEVTRLTCRGAARFPAWAEALHRASGIDPEYEKSGMRVLHPLDIAAARQWCAAHGVPMEEDQEGILLPEVAQVRNPRLMRALRVSAEKQGVRIVEQCEVREIAADGGRVKSCLTSSGEFSAGNYVVAAGAWSARVLGQHAMQLDIRPMQGQILLFKFASPPLRHIVLQGDLYLIPRRDGHLLVGSTLEDVGFNKAITEAARADLHARAARILPQLHGTALAKHWAGLRPASPGNIPVVARHPQLENCYVSSGHFRYGVTMAPASTEILVNEMTGTSQPMDVAPYRAGFHGAS